MSEQQQTLTIQQAIDLGVQHHNAGRLPEAENIYQQILQSEPNHHTALHLLGVIAHQVGKNDTAVDLIARALALKPDLAEAHSNLGLALQDLGKSEDAIASYRKALGLNPDYAEAHNNLGIALQDLGKLDEAVAFYRKALGIKPNYAEAHNNLGSVLQELGKPEEAIASYRKALAIKPDLAEAHNNLGIAIRELGHLDEAVTSYRKALALNPDYAEAHNNLGIALQGLGKLDEAVTRYHKALAIKPDFAEAYYNLGNALQDLEKLDEAVASYRKALGLKPDYVEAHNNLGNALKKLGRLDEALKIFESIDTALCYAHALECLFALGKYDEFYERQNTFMEKNRTNIRAAAISVFASQQLGRSDPHPFCKSPLDFIRVYKCLNDFRNTDGFLLGLVNELKNREAVWEPPSKTTKKGFQTLANIFDDPNGKVSDLEQIIKDYINKYRLEFSSSDCVFIRSFPKTFSLRSWFVRLLKGGHQTEHIHTPGWLSGVFYLHVPNFSNQEEGSIEFGLKGYDYPILNKSYPKNRFYPKSGDIILFPSSLFHRTIPFHSDEERMSIAFDLRPTQT